MHCNSLRRILNNRNPQPLKVSQITHLPPPLRNPLDLLDLLDLEARLFAELFLDEEGDEDGPLRVRVDAAAGAALEGRVEEGCAGGRFVDLLRW